MYSSLANTKQRKMEIKSSCIILYPSPGVGHLVSMVEFGKLILYHHPNSFSKIIFLITTAPHLNTDATAPYMTNVSATTPSIIFHHLPTTPLPPNCKTSADAINFELQSLNNPNVCQALQTITSTQYKIKAFIIDFLCNAAFDVSSGLDIPTYYFFTSPASSLSAFLYLPTIHQKFSTCLKDLNDFVQYPGLPPIFSSDHPKPALDRNSVEYKFCMETAVTMAKSDGIIINTFHSLEPRAIAAISDGLCIPHGPTPPIYCIGPLISEKWMNSEGNECLVWLHSQPSKSVVFLCFGSLGVFGGEQLKEIALGLENSGHRFLWVVRNPPPKDDDENKSILAPHELDLTTVLPQGFLERTKGRGLVVKSWAPQVAVLSHDSVGGFVTHCGWNSILEGVCAGIPMIGWPLYAEQRMNRVFLVEELRAGLWLEESDGTRFVSGVEIERRVRELMEKSKNGERVRRRVAELSDAAKVAISDEDGSSRVALTKLIAKWNLEPRVEF